MQSIGGFTPVIDENTGEITGYTTTIGGADTVFPFKKCTGNFSIKHSYMCQNDINKSTSISVTMKTDGICIGHAWHYSTGSDSMTINGESASLETIHEVKKGDVIQVKARASGYTYFHDEYASIGGVILGYSTI